MAYDAKTQRLISLKKLSGKAHTSNDKDLANEALPSGLTLASNTIFGEPITSSPVGNSLYDITGQVEYIRFQVDFIAGSDTINGRHGFELKLPADYEASSSNSKAGTYPYINNQVVNITSGSLQLVPPSFATSYEAKPYYGGDATKNSGTRIPILDESDWYLDYFNGIIFQQDPPGTGDDPENPDFIEAYLYIGQYLDEVVASGSGGGGGTGDNAAEFVLTTLTGSLPNAKLLTAGTGISIITGSNSVTISASGISTDGRDKETYYVTASQSALTPFVTDRTDYSSVDYSENAIDIFLNGVLMHTGSSSEISSATKDYRILNSGSLEFAFEIKNDDTIDTILTITSEGGGGADIAAQYLVTQQTSSLPNARLISTGSGISLRDDFSIDGTYRIQTDPRMSVYSVTSSHPPATELVIPGVDFTTNNRDFHKTQIFLNGVLMVSGSSFDYELSNTATGSLSFDIQLKADDIVIVRQS